MSATAGGRIGAYDLARGASVVSMVAFHLCYDLRFIEGVALPWFAPPHLDVWRCSISWTFVFVAGCMFAHSRDNLRRSAKYGCCALLIWAVTSVARVDVPISFGIVYCMAACTLVTWAMDRLGLRPRGPVAAVALGVAFVLLLGFPDGIVGLGPASVRLPQPLYDLPGLAWIGLPGPAFASGDYYPLLPYLLLYLAGAAWARGRLDHGGFSQAEAQAEIAPLNWAGRHALPIYLLHQPLALVASGVLASLLG